MSYTQKHEEIMLEMSIQEQEEEIFEDDILEYLEDKNSFMDFGESLTRIVRKKMPESYSEDERKFLLEKGKEQGIKFNINTLGNWFSGKTPKKGDKDRERMFQVCFSLSLNVEETIEFFQKVYGDRPFNFRNYEEFIYFCCIHNGWDYDHAKSLKKKIKFAQEIQDHTVYTRMMHSHALEFRSDDEIIDYIYNNPHNFDILNYTAKENLQELIREIKGREDEIENVQKRKISEKFSYIAQECYYNSLLWDMLKRYEGDAEYDDPTKEVNEKDNKTSARNNVPTRETNEKDNETSTDNIVLIQEANNKEQEALTEKNKPLTEDKKAKRKKKQQNRVWTNKSFHSQQTMIDVIYGIKMKDARETGESGFIKNSRLPKAVKGRFPDQQTLKNFSSGKITTEELRKMIILLYSYKFWIIKKYKNPDLGFEEYRDGLNNLLYESYLQKLYIGNPFDWIFMFCTLSEDPLSLFRILMGEGILGN